MKKEKFVQIGSCPLLGGLEGMADLIKKKWGWQTVEFIPTGDHFEWHVASGTGVVKGLRVVVRRQRYRFEMATME